MNDQAQPTDHWTLDKRVPVALIITVVLQFIALLVSGSVFASKIDSRVTSLETARERQVTLNDTLVTAQTDMRVSLAKIEAGQVFAAQTLQDIKQKLNQRPRTPE